MMVRMFRPPGKAAPAAPPRFPRIPPANSPPYRRSEPHANVRKAIAATLAARQAED
jgi:hypothetical protein